MEKPHVSSKQIHEFTATLRSVKGLHAGPVLFTTAGLKGFDQDGKTPIVEFDGIVVTQDRRKDEIIVTLIEAKHKRKRAERDAREALRKKTQKVKINDSASVGGIKSKIEAKKAWAWRHIRMSYSNKNSEG